MGAAPRDMEPRSRLVRGPSDPVFERNTQLLRRELRALLRSARSVSRAGVPQDGLQAMALGSLVAGQQLARGVLAETRARPPRALNAVRLARHLWELETELHYVIEDQAPRLEQMVARDAIRTLELHRSFPKKQRPKMDAQLEALFDHYEAKAKPRDKQARERRAVNEAVDANDWGSTPDRLIICKELNRVAEYGRYYAWASLYSHPSVKGLDSGMRLTEGRVIVEDGGERSAMLASQALSLTRVFLCRLVLRAARVIGAPKVEADIVNYMGELKMAETGVYRSPE